MKAFKAGQTAYIAKWVGDGLGDDGISHWKISSTRPVTLSQGGKVRVRYVNRWNEQIDVYVISRSGRDFQNVWHEDPLANGAEVTTRNTTAAAA